MFAKDVKTLKSKLLLDEGVSLSSPQCLSRIPTFNFLNHIFQTKHFVVHLATLGMNVREVYSLPSERKIVPKRLKGHKMPCLKNYYCPYVPRLGIITAENRKNIPPPYYAQSLVA